MESNPRVEGRECPCCRIARQFSDYRMFNPACIYCGARMIQTLGKLRIPASQCSARRTAALHAWMEYGHDEQQIRSMVKGPLAIGPEKGSVCEDRPRTKRR